MKKLLIVIAVLAMLGAFGNIAEANGKEWSCDSPMGQILNRCQDFEDTDTHTDNKTLTDFRVLGEVGIPNFIKLPWGFRIGIFAGKDVQQTSLDEGWYSKVGLYWGGTVFNFAKEKE